MCCVLCVRINDACDTQIVSIYYIFRISYVQIRWRISSEQEFFCIQLKNICLFFRNTWDAFSRSIKFRGTKYVVQFSFVYRMEFLMWLNCNFTTTTQLVISLPKKYIQKNGRRMKRSALTHEMVVVPLVLHTCLYLECHWWYSALTETLVCPSAGSIHRTG